MFVQYRIHDVAVRVRWADAVLGPVVDEVVRYYGLCRSVPARPDLQIVLALVDDLPPLPPGAREAAQFDFGINAWRTPGCTYLRDVHSHIEVDVATSAVAISLRRGLLEDRPLLSRRLLGCLVLSQIILLRHCDLYMVHAAALAKDGQGLVLVAPSDCGKSTISLSLVREGWQYLSDDAIFLRPGAAVEAIPFRRNFALDPEATGDFPEIGAGWDTPFTEEERLCVPVGSLFTSQALERCVPDVLVFPRIVDQPESHLLPVTKADALGHLMTQSALLTLEPELAPRHLDVLRRLVTQTHHYRLLAGRDLKANPAKVTALLEPALERAAALASMSAS